jgi:hypothetical protein
MSFDVGADAYMRFMGRYSEPLREQCRRRLPAGPVEISATAWAATSRT